MLPAFFCNVFSAVCSLACRPRRNALLSVLQTAEILKTARAVTEKANYPKSFTGNDGYSENNSISGPLWHDSCISRVGRAIMLPIHTRIGLA